MSTTNTASSSTASSSTATLSATSTTTTASGSSSSGGGVTTPGKIQCGASACDLSTQKCCYDTQANTGQCVPNDGMTTCANQNEISATCDDESDCAAGDVCCADTANGSYSFVACEQPPTGPNGTTCKLGEVCILGGACSGLQCKADMQAKPSGASCVSDHPGASCGAQTCSGSMPVCCWNYATPPGDGSCAQSTCPPPSASTNDLTLACTAPSDCATGYVCCFVGIGSVSYCTGACDPQNGLMLCSSAADCPTSAPNCIVDPGTSLPTGVKHCST
jgi:hypothetical protein